jgi:ribonuclease P protein component
MALSGAHRLSLRFERERLTKTGKTVFGKYFTLVTAESSDKSLGVPRLAILLSKKTANLATDRNKIKRTTSSLIESFLSTLPPKDYLVIPKRQVLTEGYESLKEDFKDLFAK